MNRYKIPKLTSMQRHILWLVAYEGIPPPVILCLPQTSLRANSLSFMKYYLTNNKYKIKGQKYFKRDKDITAHVKALVRAKCITYLEHNKIPIITLYGIQALWNFSS